MRQLHERKQAPGFVRHRPGAFPTAQLRPPVDRGSIPSRLLTFKVCATAEAASATDTRIETRNAPIERAVAPATKRVYFEVFREVAVGEDVRVVGDLQELGAWDASQGLALQWHPGNVWRGSVQLPAGAQFMYKLVKAGADGVCVEWEEGEDRILDLQELPTSGVSASVLWGHPAEYSSCVPYSKEETVATGDMESAGDAPPALEGSVEGSYTARIAIQKELCLGQHLKLVGSDPVLGEWDFRAAPAFTWSPEHVWQLELQLPLGTPVDWKIVQAVEGNDDWCEWQTGENTIVDPSALHLSSGDILEVGCTWEGPSRATIVETVSSTAARNDAAQPELINVTEEPVYGSDGLLDDAEASTAAIASIAHAVSTRPAPEATIEVQAVQDGIAAFEKPTEEALSQEDREFRVLDETPPPPPPPAPTEALSEASAAPVPVVEPSSTPQPQPTASAVPQAPEQQVESPEVQESPVDSADTVLPPPSDIAPQQAVDPVTQEPEPVVQTASASAAPEAPAVPVSNAVAAPVPAPFTDSPAAPVPASAASMSPLAPPAPTAPVVDVGAAAPTAPPAAAGNDVSSPAASVSAAPVPPAQNGASAAAPPANVNAVPAPPESISNGSAPAPAPVEPVAPAPPASADSPSAPAAASIDPTTGSTVDADADSEQDILKELQASGAGLEDIVLSPEQLSKLAEAGLPEGTNVTIAEQDDVTFELQKGRLDKNGEGSTIIVRGGMDYDSDTGTVTVNSPLGSGPDGLLVDTNGKSLEAPSEVTRTSGSTQQPAVKLISPESIADVKPEDEVGVLTKVGAYAGMAAAGLGAATLMGGLAVDLADVAVIAGLYGVASAIGTSQNDAIRAKGAAGPVLSALVTAADIAKRMKGASKDAAKDKGPVMPTIGKYEKSQTADVSKRGSMPIPTDEEIAAMQAEHAITRKAELRAVEMQAQLGENGMQALEDGVNQVMSTDVQRILKALDSSLKDEDKVIHLVKMLINGQPAACKTEESLKVEVRAAMILAEEHVEIEQDPGRKTQHAPPVLLAALAMSAVDEMRGVKTV